MTAQAQAQAQVSASGAGNAGPTFTIVNRTLFNMSLPRVSPAARLANPGAVFDEAMTLDEVLGYLNRVETAQRPEDQRLPINRFSFSFEGGRLTARIINGDGTVLYFTQVGAQQLSSFCLPSFELRNLRSLSELHKPGEALAGVVANTWAQSADPKQRLVRFASTKHPDTGKVVRVVRSAHSADYAPYSNVQYVKDLLEHGGEIAQMPVISWGLMDNVMRIRFAAALPTDSDDIVPTIEAWNSETGSRRVILRGGLYRTASGLALPASTESLAFQWRHYGNPDRIRQGVKAAFEGLRLAATGAIESYREALLVDIDGAVQWMEDQLAELQAAQRIVDASKAALTSEFVTKNSKLASVVDAVAVAGSEQEDVELQSEFEDIAAELMKRGLRAAGTSRRIEVT